YQSCIMAPTEILASQHFNNFQKFFPNSNVKLLTSKIKGKQREKILFDLKEGNIDVLIGTHALIEENVEFKNLALIVIDEQHKFGVNQRFKLYSKSDCPHLIVMSATPIPRTLALTVYSDLDISVINQMPPGRKKAITEIFNYKDLNKVYNFVEKQLSEGRQAYVVCPSIFENPKIALKNVETIYYEIKERFNKYQVAYLHGKMNPKEKDKIMEKFRENIYSILVSTTVVEVGVDVPNANVIVVLDAERFGLSQLHQLRGRVKRSHHQPYCLLVTSKNLSSLDFSKSLQRLSILKYYDDGFKIAEKDLELRGPGEILGYKQHGFTEFKVLNPIKDQELIKFSNYLARKIYSFANQSDFLKQKLNEIKTKIESIADTI
ncbi:MAG: ATP-dependent DNA helicase RecG, partial [bacterium]